jgi:hypothetical protein
MSVQRPRVSNEWGIGQDARHSSDALNFMYQFFIVVRRRYEADANF